MSRPVQNARWSDALRKYFGLRGHLGATINTDILPVMELGSNLDCDHRHVRGEQLLQGSTGQNAVAGQRAQLALVNPAGSKVLTCVEQFWLSLGVAGSIDIFLLTGDPVGVQFPVPGGFHSGPRDGRNVDPGASAPRIAMAYLTGRTSAGALSPGQPLANQWFAAAGAGATSTPGAYEVVLPPKCALVFEAGLLNAGLNVSLLWRERPATEEELAA